VCSEHWGFITTQQQLNKRDYEEIVCALILRRIQKWQTWSHQLIQKDSEKDKCVVIVSPIEAITTQMASKLSLKTIVTNIRQRLLSNASTQTKRTENLVVECDNNDDIEPLLNASKPTKQVSVPPNLSSKPTCFSSKESAVEVKTDDIINESSPKIRPWIHSREQDGDQITKRL